MPKVDYNSNNLKKCRCSVCPVQAKSGCVNKLMAKMQALAGQSAGPNQETMPDPKDVPSIYCATGKAFCKDLDPTQVCLCPTCRVWQENNLSSNYYCQKGSAEETG